jgi:hypothetical protein
MNMGGQQMLLVARRHDSNSIAPVYVSHRKPLERDEHYRQSEQCIDIRRMESQMPL